MPRRRASASCRSCVPRLAFAGLFGALTGCGAATPAATTPAHAEVEVVVPSGEPVAMSALAKAAMQGESDGPRDVLSAGGALTALDDAAIVKMLESGGSAGVLGALKGVDLSGSGGVVGGVLGGSLSGSGIGGLGMSGIGAGGGGTGVGIGLGGLGTIGRGSGTGSGYGISGGGYRSDPVSGTSISVGSRSVIEFGDSATLGVSAEQATRALRGQFQKLRECYEQKGLDVSARAEGGMVLRLVIGSDGAIKYAVSAAPFLPNKGVVECVTKALTKVYVGPPPSGSFGVIETVISFRPKV